MRQFQFQFTDTDFLMWVDDTVAIKFESVADLVDFAKSILAQEEEMLQQEKYVDKMFQNMT